MKRKVLSLIVVFCMVVALIPAATIEAGAASYAPAKEITYTCTGNQAQDIIGIAKTQIGYTSTDGKTVYGAWYGVQTEWCAIFVSWCANKAGIPTTVVPKLTTADRSWYQERDIYEKSSYRGGNYTPKTGDIIFFSWNGNDYAQHVGMVEKVSNGYVYTVEGNSGDAVRAKSYPLSSSYILGYGTPKYTGAIWPSLMASNVASTGKVKLTWSFHDTATKYYIYRSTSKSSGFKYIGRTTENTYTDNDGEASYLYYYKVKAVTDAGKVLSVSDIVSRTCDCAQPIIVGISNVASSGKINLQWKDVENANRYDIYRATSANGTYTKMKTFSTTMNTGKTYSYINTSAKAGTQYWYKVVARNSNNIGADSAMSSAWSRTCDLARPTDVKASNATKGKIKVTWDKVSGATSYKIYRKTGSKGTYKLQYTTTKCSYTNTSVKKGKTYYYKIKAVMKSNANATSAYSAAVYKKVR